MNPLYTLPACDCGVSVGGYFSRRSGEIMSYAHSLRPWLRQDISCVKLTSRNYTDFIDIILQACCFVNYTAIWDSVPETNHYESDGGSLLYYRLIHGTKV